jgi:hypothetical protein
MGAPTSALLSETYIQHMENKHMYPVLRTRQIIAYLRYVDDIIYNQNKTNIEQTLKKFNSLTAIHKMYYRERTTRRDKLFRSHNTSQGEKVGIFSIQETHMGLIS